MKRGMGLEGVKEAYRRANRRRERPVGEKTGGGAPPPELRDGWRWKTTGWTDLQFVETLGA